MCTFLTINTYATKFDVMSEDFIVAGPFCELIDLLLNFNVHIINLTTGTATNMVVWSNRCIETLLGPADLKL